MLCCDQTQKLISSEFHPKVKTWCSFRASIKFLDHYWAARSLLISSRTKFRGSPTGFLYLSGTCGIAYILGLIGTFQGHCLLSFLSQAIDYLHHQQASSIIWRKKCPAGYYRALVLTLSMQISVYSILQCSIICLCVYLIDVWKHCLREIQIRVLTTLCITSLAHPSHWLTRAWIYSFV